MSFNQPGKSDVHVDGPLSQISVAFRQDAEAFIADRAFPVLSVRHKTDKYYVLPRGRFYSDEMEKRAAGARAASANWTVSTDSYSADVWALANDIPDQVLANADSQLDLRREAVEFLTLKGLIRKEALWASEFFTTGVWTLDQTGVDSATPAANQFGQFNRSDSDPVKAMRAIKTIVHKRTGYMPNKLVLGREVFNTILDNPFIVGRLDRGQTTGPVLVMKNALAALFELDEILVMDSVVNTAKEGAADVIGYIGGKSALLLYVPSSPGLRTPSAGYTMAWSGMMGGDALGMRIKRMRMEPEESERIELQMSFDHKKVSADLGIFLATAVA